MVRRKKQNSVLDTKIKISLGKSAYSNVLVQKELTIGAFFNTLTTPEIRPKKDGKYFIFASFKENERNAHNVGQYYGAAIDIDDSSISIADIRAALRTYCYALYTTYSHKRPGKGDRYRIVIPYKYPVSANDHIDIVLYLTDRLGFDSVDLSSKTLSLPMYLPSVSQAYASQFHYEYRRGKLLDPASETIRDKVPEIKFKRFSDQNLTHEPIDINKSVQDGERNSSLARIVGKFIQQGMAKDDVMQMASTFNTTKIVPPLDDAEVETIVNSVIKSHSRNTGDLAWGFDEIVRRMADKKRAVDEYEQICKIIAYGKLHNKFTPAELEILVNELRVKTGVTKKTINSALTDASLDIQGQEQENVEEVVKNESESIRQRFKNWVFIATDDRLYNIYTGEYYKREAFNAMFHMPDLKVAIFTILVKYNLINKVSRVEFDPLEKAIYTRNRVKYVNTYIDPDIEAVDGDYSILTDHFEYLLPNETERNIVLDFISFLIQKPGHKIRWMPIIKGTKGVGKSIIAEKIIMPLIGYPNFGKVDNQLIKSDFNAWQLNKQLIVFEELNIGESAKEKKIFTDRLKSFITDDISKAHRKGMDPYDVINRSCCIGFTNFHDPVVITVDERRFCMIRTEAKPKEDIYYKRLIRWCENNVGVMYHYFMNRDVKKFRYMRAPETEYTAEVRATSVPWPASILYEAAMSTKHIDVTKYGMLTYSSIIELIKNNSTGKYRALADDLGSPGSSLSKALNTALNDLGYRRLEFSERKDQRLFIRGKKEHIWVLPGKLAAIKLLRATEVRNKLNDVTDVLTAISNRNDINTDQWD